MCTKPVPGQPRLNGKILSQGGKKKKESSECSLLSLTVGECNGFQGELGLKQNNFSMCFVCVLLYIIVEI